MKTAGAMFRMNLVIQSPTSVDPATIVAFGVSSSTAARSSTLAGTTTRSSPVVMSTRAPSSSAASRASTSARSTDQPVGLRCAVAARRLRRL